MENGQSIVKKTETSFDDIRNLWGRRKGLCIIVICILLVPSIILTSRLYFDFLVKAENAKLKSKIERLTQDRDSKAAQLAPFLAVANLKFEDSPKPERLDNLFNLIQDFKDNTEAKLSKLPLQRRIGHELKIQIETELKSIAPIPIYFGAVMGDVESYNLAKEIAYIFIRAGWSDIKLGYANANRNPKGIQVYGPYKIGDQLINSLSKISNNLGLNIDISVDKNYKQNITWVIVGGQEK